MSSVLRVLVTGVAGDLGQALVKALRLAAPPFEVHGSDLADDSYAAAFVASYHRLPLARSEEYFEQLEEMCAGIRVVAVVPGSEPEIRALGGRDLSNGVRVVSQPASWLQIYGDKLAAMRSLGKAVDLPAFADPGEPGAVEAVVGRCGFPLVVKGRWSSGGRKFAIVRNDDELRRALHTVEQPLVQEYLDDSGGEYSVGLFRCPDFEATICFRRELDLAGGFSRYAELAPSAEIEDYALRIATVAGALGSVNVQVRLTRRGPRLLEMNPRFSSLAAARAVCGFCDVEWSVALALGLPLRRPPIRRPPMRFHRFCHEVVDLGQGYGALSAWSPRSLEGITTSPPTAAAAGSASRSEAIGRRSAGSGKR
jgi:carbamoyl-phosphate synthase large subunit